jgi:hypothetical protein
MAAAMYGCAQASLVLTTSGAGGSNTTAMSGSSSSGSSSSSAASSSGATACTNEPAQPQPGLGAWYRFEGTTGPVCDSSGNGNHGTVVGAGVTRGTSGKFGSAISFSGSTGRVNVPPTASLDMITAGSFELWIRMPTIHPLQAQPQIYYATVSRGTGNNDNNIYNLTICGGLYNYFTYNHVQALGGGAPCNTIAAMTWAHVAVVNDGKTTSTYVNGVLAGTTAGGDLGPLDSPLSIGQLEQGVFPMVGDIDEVKWWTVARTAAEVCTDAGGTVVGSMCALP